MPRSFDIPEFYRSSIVSNLKRQRKEGDRTKRDFTPSVLELGPLTVKIARHFGFCFGVENAIEIAYRALQENPDKRVFLLSEMIHNPHVNEDLQKRGVQFLQSTKGEELIPLSTLKSDDVVIVPAFGTTVELFDRLRSIGIDPKTYDATCPFVVRVWKRGRELSAKGYTIVLHGKHDHEETRATFSHTCEGHAGVVVRDLAQAIVLEEYIRGKRSEAEFWAEFEGLTTDGFDPERDMKRIGVINQTTMLATETHEISMLLKQAVQERYGEGELSSPHFADTRDTLCYATTENQESIRGLLASGGDVALVVGGYNSSNTSHLVELLEPEVPTYYVKDHEEIKDADSICHLSLHEGEVVKSSGWLPEKRPLTVLLSAGASCPDAQVDRVLRRVVEICGVEKELEEALSLMSESSIQSEASSERLRVVG